MRMLRLEAVMDVTGYSRASIYKKMDDGTFPQKVKLGGKAVAWVETEVLDWVNSRIAQRDDAQKRAA